MAKKTRIYSHKTLRAINLLATLIQAARKRKGWSEAVLAERCGATRPTIRRIERANPATEIGLYFEIAHILGIPLFSDDLRQVAALEEKLELELAVLPQRIRKDTRDVFDDF
jgi:transcriptional regulator with XRE-family HTH domain